MGRSPCSSKFEGLRRGAWTANEDMALCKYIRIHGEGGWTNLPQKAGLMRNGKSCRLRWLNYLRPDIKRGNISSDEEELIIRLHRLLGNRWSLIAGRLPGRTDNEIRNYWTTYLGKAANLKERSATPSPINTHLIKPIPSRITTEERHPPMSYGNINEAFPLSVATNSSLSWSDQLLSNSDNLPEKEGRNSICDMTSLARQRSPDWDHFAGETANLGDNSLDMNELLSTNCYLCSSPSGFGLEELFEESPLAAAETNEFHQGNNEAFPLSVATNLSLSLSDQLLSNSLFRTTPSPINMHLFKPIPSRITTTTEERHPPMSYGNINEAFPLSVATNSSLSWSDQLLSNSDNLPEKEGRNCICDMTSLARQRSPDWDHFAGETANLDDNSLDMNELLSTNCYLFSSPSGFGLEELFEEFPLAAAETNEFLGWSSYLDPLF